MARLRSRLETPKATKKGKPTVAVEDRNKSPTKVIAIPPAMGVEREIVYGNTKGWHKNEAVLCPSRMRSQFRPDRSRLPEGDRQDPVP